MAADCIATVESAAVVAAVMVMAVAVTLATMRMPVPVAALRLVPALLASALVSYAALQLMVRVCSGLLVATARSVNCIAAPIPLWSRRVKVVGPVLSSPLAVVFPATARIAGEVAGAR